MKDLLRNALVEFLYIRDMAGSGIKQKEVLSDLLEGEELVIRGDLSQLFGIAVLKHVIVRFEVGKMLVSLDLNSFFSDTSNFKSIMETKITKAQDKIDGLNRDIETFSNVLGDLYNKVLTDDV